LQTTSTVFFFIDLVLFIIFSLIFLLRLIWFRRQAGAELFHVSSQQPDHDNNTDETDDDLGYLAAWPLVWMTLVAFAAVIAPELGQHSQTARTVSHLAYTAWWIGAAWTVVTTLVILAVPLLSSPPDQQPKQKILPPSTVFPPMALAFVAFIGALIVSNLLSATATTTGLSPPKLATVPVIIFALCAIGAALFMSLILYPIILIHQLTTPLAITHSIHTHQSNPSQLICTQFYLVGALSMSAASLQLLGTALSTIPGNGNSPSTPPTNGAAFLTNTTPTLISVPCILFALLLFGMASLTFLLALITLIYTACLRNLQWTMSWHGILLPVAALGLSSLQFSVELGSSFFRVLASVLLVLIVVAFLVNLAFTVWFAWKGRVLIVRDDPRTSSKQVEWDHLHKFM
ncbi:voltage-dependent anion channel, partial [Apodospora peruviana]